MDPEYMELVKEWVLLDNKIIISRDSVVESCEFKKDLEEQILNHLKEKQIDALKVTINDGVILFSKTTTKAPLSVRMLKVMCEQYNEGPDAQRIDVEDFMNYVTNNIESKTKTVMRRVIKAP